MTEPTDSPEYRRTHAPGPGSPEYEAMDSLAKLFERQVDELRGNATSDSTTKYFDILPRRDASFPHRLLTTEGVSVIGDGTNRAVEVSGAALEALAYEAFKEVNYFLRPAHLAQLRHIVEDPESSGNDRYVALDLLKNANVASGGVLPMCQDTGTALVHAKRGHRIVTDGDDRAHLWAGIARAYRDLNLRYSQMAATTLWDEVNTKSNMPAEIDISMAKGDSYEFLFMAKGGGSANKSFLYQETRAILDESRMLDFLREKIESIGTAACPPYHLAVVIGGTSADFALKTAKLASTKYLDTLPTEETATGRDSATSTSNRKCSNSPRQSGSARSSAESTSATTSVSCVYLDTGHLCRSPSPFRARPIGKSWRPSMRTACSSKSSNTNPPASSRRRG